MPASDEAYEAYRRPPTRLPDENLGWNTYGVGVEAMGRDGAPEHIDVTHPGPDQLLVRVDAVGLCYSDVKLIRQGGNHPKLYGRDLSEEPTRLGHEATVTVVEVGEDLADRYQPGQRLAIQPDIYVGGRSTAYGYTIPGGLIQFHLIGPEVLDADDGAYVIPVDDSIGYAAAALSEPWACVEAAYTQRRRLEPLEGGRMWIVGQPGDENEYRFSRYLDRPALIVLTDAPEAIAAQARRTGAEVIHRDGLDPSQYRALSDELTGGDGFDDIVLLGPRRAEQVDKTAALIAFRGTLNLVGDRPLDGLVAVDLGRIHYHYTAYYGNPGPDVAASYGEERNRCELCPGGVALFVGAAGPMGQMHIQRALELPDGPSTIIASDVDPTRLAVLEAKLGPLAERRERRLAIVDPSADPEALAAIVEKETAGRGADDVIVTVPVGETMSDSAQLMAPDGMLVLFAGAPVGTVGPLDLSAVYLQNAQYTGTSGSRISDQQLVIDKAVAGLLSPERSLAAVGGIEAGRDGVQAMLEGRFAGKIVIFPQLKGLPLMGLEELAERYPAIGRHLGDGWSPEAERELIETFWKPA